MRKDKVKQWVEDHKKEIFEDICVGVLVAGGFVAGVKYADSKYKPSMEMLMIFGAMLKDLGNPTDLYIAPVKNSIDFDSIVGVIGKEMEKKISEALGTDLYDTNMSIIFAK